MNSCEHFYIDEGGGGIRVLFLAGPTTLSTDGNFILAHLSPAILVSVLVLKTLNNLSGERFAKAFTSHQPTIFIYVGCRSRHRRCQWIK